MILHQSLFIFLSKNKTLNMGKKRESHFFPNFSLSRFHSVIEKKKKKKNDENKFEEHRMTNLKINRVEKYMRKGNAIINIISVFGNRSIEYYMIELMKIMFERLMLKYPGFM